MKRIYLNHRPALLASWLLLLPAFMHRQNATKPIATKNGAIESAMNDAYNKYKDLKEGKNADYIPELAKVPSEQFAIVIVTADGQVYSKGDIDALFSIQSISKVFTLAEN